MATLFPPGMVHTIAIITGGVLDMSQHRKQKSVCTEASSLAVTP
jgi:hypothetical protein